MPREPGPGNSFRAIYALAADQTEIPDHVAAIRNEIEAVNSWYATQTFGAVQPRWMRVRHEDGTVGGPEVEVVRLAHDAAAYRDGGFTMAYEDVMAASPLAAPTQGTVVWMDVVGTACGVGSADRRFAWLPEATCNIRPTTTSRWPYGATYLLAHELTHVFGALDRCAPTSTGDGHVKNDRRDVIYAGPDGRDWANLMLDPGRDDYYGSGACGDIAGSPFWTRTSSPGS